MAENAEGDALWNEAMEIRRRFKELHGKDDEESRRERARLEQRYREIDRLMAKPRPAPAPPKTTRTLGEQDANAICHAIDEASGITNLGTAYATQATNFIAALNAKDVRSLGDALHGLTTIPDVHFDELLIQFIVEAGVPAEDLRARIPAIAPECKITRARTPAILEAAAKQIEAGA